ncbi:MAG: response regulator [Candidatus Omnitrophica bacterium]|nr:response regulator [Candidatus Omnitrophota bacterium]MCM8788992.1 response regulator [Candidatus Omnitrophota bacterium]
MAKKILLIEDETNQRILYTETLEKEGYQVDSVSNGEDGLKLLEKKDVDLVIIDIRMPKMSGLETLSNILGRRKNLPVIIYTSYPQYKQDFMSWAADAYIVKSSTSLDELITKVKELIGA